MNLNGVKKELYIRELVKIKYRDLLYIEMTYTGVNDGKIFEDCSEDEIVIFATLLIDDVQKLYEYLEKVKREYSLEHVEFKEYEIIEKQIDELVRKMDIEYSKDMDVNELLTDSSFMRAFIDVFSQIRLFNKDIEEYINKIKEDREKQEEEKRKEAEEVRRKQDQMEKDKNISPEEMREVIKKIDNDSFDVTDSYKDIMKYETRVAEVRGLLNAKSKISTDDLAIIRIPKDEVGMYIRNAKEQGIVYTVLYGVDDNPEQSCMIIVSKNDESKAKIDVEDNYTGATDIKLSGIYGKSFINFCREMQYNIVRFNEKMAYATNGNKNRYKEQIKSHYKDILKLNNKEYLENVKFYIELPYLRPIIPILELLQKNGIEYYIPPINEEFRKTKPTVKIYIDRENYDKYMDEVHKQISNANLGIITVHIEESFSDIMLEETNSPYIDEERANEVMITLK